MRVVCWNMAGVIGFTGKRPADWAWLKEHEVDMALLQEVVLAGAELSTWTSWVYAQVDRPRRSQPCRTKVHLRRERPGAPCSEMLECSALTWKPLANVLIEYMNGWEVAEDVAAPRPRPGRGRPRNRWYWRLVADSKSPAQRHFWALTDPHRAP
jgi:hypothetical protein